MSLFVNRIRFFSYIAGVLHTQQFDPLCGNCRAFVNTTLKMREEIDLFEAEHSEELPSRTAALRDMLANARNSIAAITLPADAPGQKKAGKCLMPEGICFVKYSKKLLDSVG